MKELTSLQCPNVSKFSHHPFTVPVELLSAAPNCNQHWLICDCWFRDVCLLNAGRLTCWKSHDFTCWQQIPSGIICISVLSFCLHCICTQCYKIVMLVMSALESISTKSWMVERVNEWLRVDKEFHFGSFPVWIMKCFCLKCFT